MDRRTVLKTLASALPFGGYLVGKIVPGHQERTEPVMTAGHTAYPHDEHYVSSIWVKWPADEWNRLEAEAVDPTDEPMLSRVSSFTIEDDPVYRLVYHDERGTCRATIPRQQVDGVSIDQLQEEMGRLCPLPPAEQLEERGKVAWIEVQTPGSRIGEEGIDLATDEAREMVRSYRDHVSA